MKKSCFLWCITAALMSYAVLPVRADVAQDVEAHMEYIRTHEHRSLNKTQDMKAQPGAVIASLWKYIDDPHEGVRSKTAGMAAAISEQENNDAAVRQEAVELLLTAIDNEPIPHLAQMAAVRMMSLPPSLFSRRARDIIHRMMSRDRVESEIIRMAGVANVQTPQVKRRLQRMVALEAVGDTPVLDAAGKPVPLTPREQVDRSNGRAARWALAAMGDKAAITPFVAAFNAAFNAEHPVSSYGAWTPALQDLLHLRQPEAIAALVQVLFRDERLPSTVDPGPGQEAPFVSPPGPYVAFDALSYLSRYVENWPSKAFPPSAEGLQQAREWVTKQGIANLKIKR